MEFNQVLYDRKPQPQSAMASRSRAVSLPESLEDVRQDVGRDALAGVGNRQYHVAAVSAERERDMSSGRRELQSVRHEIVDDLTKT